MYSETDKAYLAGFIDGEGTVAIDTHGNQRTPSVRLIIGNTQKQTLEELKELWGGCLSTKKPQKEGWKAVSVLEWSTKKAVEILKDVQPYLRIKRNHSKIAIEFQETVNSMEHRTKSIPPDVQAYRLELKERLHALNKRGTKE